MSDFSIGDSMPNCELCTLTIDGPVANITLAREEVFNALNPQLISEFCDLLDWTAERSAARCGEITDANAEPYLRVVVVRGSGKHFCAGADIGWMQASGAQSDAENRADAERLDRLFNTLFSHPCFTIGAVQGVALGGGAGLVSCIDHVIAEPRTRIALSEGKLGILPAVIGPYVYRRLGSAQTRRLAMLAKRIDSDEAFRVGLVDQVVSSPDFFDEAILEVCGEVMTTGPVAVAQAKQLVLTFDCWSGSDDELRTWTLDKTSQMRGSEEGQEGLSSFIEGRSPAWNSDE